MPCATVTPYSPNQPPDLIDQRGALLDQQMADTMLGLHVLLLGRLNRYETHVPAAHLLTDRLGVVDIVLLAFHVRLDELRAGQPHLVTVPRELARPGMGTAAGLHADKAPWQLHILLQVRTQDRQLVRGEHTLTTADFGAKTLQSFKATLAIAVEMVVYGAEIDL